MTVWRHFFITLLAISFANAATFETYYGTDRPDSPQSATQAPAPREPFRVNAPAAQPQTPATQTPQNAVQPRTPAAREAQAPVSIAPFQTRRTVLTAAPHGVFGLKGNYLLRASVGFSSLERKVSVDTLGGGQAVYYRPKNKFMGYSNGKTLTYDDDETRWRYQLGVGYQLPNEGNFWYLEYARAKETSELDGSFAISLPSLRIENVIPYVKLGVNLGFSDSEGISPSSLGVLLGAGGYNYLNDAKSVRLEYGLDYSRTEWLPIPHGYGDEKWTDTLWHIYFGAAYRF
jgi:hypothetical protein